MKGGSPGRNSPRAGNNSPRKSKPRNQPLVPVTIRQIHDAAATGGQDATEFSIDGQTVLNVSILGQVLGSQELSTNLNYSIDDATATIDVRVWMDSDGNNEFVRNQAPSWEKGRYVRVVGTIHQFKNVRSLVASKLMLVEDSNEIMYHHLEALQNHLQRTKGKSVGSSTSSASTATTATVPTAATTGLARQVSGTSVAGLNDVQSYCVDLIRQGDPTVGVTIEQLVQSLAGHATEAQVRDAMQTLFDEGTIFPTSDENHFALTEQ